MAGGIAEIAISGSARLKRAEIKRRPSALKSSGSAIIAIPLARVRQFETEPAPLSCHDLSHPRSGSSKAQKTRFSRDVGRLLAGSFEINPTSTGTLCVSTITEQNFSCAIPVCRTTRSLYDASWANESVAAVTVCSEARRPSNMSLYWVRSFPSKSLAVAPFGSSAFSHITSDTMIMD